jgi:hypothetical protein
MAKLLSQMCAQTNVATVTVNIIKGPTLYNDIPLTIKDCMLLKPQYNLMWILFLKSRLSHMVAYLWSDNTLVGHYSSFFLEFTSQALQSLDNCAYPKTVI